MLPCASRGRHALIAVIWWLSLTMSSSFTRKAKVSIQNNPDGSSVLRIGNAATIEFLQRPSRLADKWYRPYNLKEESSLMDDSSQWEGAGSTGCLVSGELRGKHAGWAALSTCPHLQGFIATQHGGYLLHSMRQGNSIVDKIFDAPRFVPRLHDRSKRNTVDAFRIRVLLLADHSIRQHHNSRVEAEKYLLAIMNIVRHVFHDQSLGHAVSVSLAGTVFLTKHESKTVNSSTICSWQQVLRKRSGISPYDIAVFFTRQSVCHHKSASYCKHTVGYSLVGSICDQAASCIAVRDHGLTSAFTIAHEIGHSLGLTHDGLKEACPANVFVMSPEVVKLTHPYQWSPCSREELHSLVQSGHLHCLRSKSTSEQEWPQLPPKHVYTPEEQCRFRHGQNATSCAPDKWAICQLLWCRIGSGECTPDGHPPADGTECWLPGSAAHGVCYRESCVSRNSTALQPVDGGWSEWSQWSACSCSCGTGIAASSRNCTSPAPRNGGRPCVGVRTRYKTCNTQKCAVDHVVVQKQNQCQARNSHWTALNNAEIHRLALNPCQLHCINKDSSLQANIGPVTDGTHCWSHRNDLCIKGECITVGCDLQLNSGMALDQCGVCGGNGSSCISVSRVILTGNNLGLRHVITFPSRATHAVLGLHHSSMVVVFKEVATGTSRLLGGESSFTSGGAKWSWKHSGMKKILIAPGPITHSVAVIIYSLTVNVKVQYSFVLPRGAPGRHQWQEAADKGELVCMDLSTGNCHSKEVCSSTKVFSSIGLVTSNATEGQLGSYSWWTSQWSQCMGVCSRGHQVRAVFCQGRDSRVVNDTHCSSPMPQQARNCSVTNKCLYSWKSDEWSNCSTTCGSGNQTRNIHCVTLYGQRVNSAFCVASLKPVQSTKCFDTSSCGEWKTSNWAECQGTHCGTGYQRRDVSCVGKNTPKGAQNTYHCLQQERPQVRRQCSVPCRDSTPNATSCVDSLPSRHCQYVAAQRCSNQIFAVKCCKSCNLRQQQQ